MNFISFLLIKKEYGWGKWKSISQIIETRDMNQVRQFAGTVVGRRYKPLLVLSQGYLDLAAGIKVVAEGLGAHSRSGMVEGDESGIESEED